MTGNHLLGHDPAEDLICSTWIGEEKERTVGGAVLSLFLLVTKRLYGKEWEWSIGQIKTCRKKQHVEIDDIKEMSDLICGKAAVGGNYNSTRDNIPEAVPSEKRISKRYRPVKGLVSGYFWGYEKMDYHHPWLGSGLWRTEHYVRRTLTRVSKRRVKKTGGKPPALDIPVSNCYI